MPASGRSPLPHPCVTATGASGEFMIGSTPSKTALATSLVVLAVALLGCAGRDLRVDAAELQGLIAKARKNGARNCAPKELALAEVHLDRAKDEMDLGNYFPAKKHKEIAERYAKEAYKKSPPARCIHLDRDGDGIPDAVDKCPEKPEDKDGFEDEDGCPDHDNDGDGIPDKDDKCPDDAEDMDGFEDEDGCPDEDNDEDKIPDTSDKCPNKPEDYDGFQDEDGCPDEDNDGDKILDVSDKCPNRAEDFDGDQDDDGCPDIYKLVVVTAKKIELRQKVYFATGKSVIRRRSFALLNEVGQVLRDNPKMHVRIEGHTDSRGGTKYNLRLSQGRAKSVLTYLVKKRIDPVRLDAAGFGEEKPIADNRTRSGRTMNRRVEFLITKQ